MAKKTKKPKRDVPMCTTHPEWSASRYKIFIRSAMRSAWLKWPPRYLALIAARRPSMTGIKRQKWEYQCCVCLKWHMGKNISVDHIIPWGNLEGLSLDQAWRRLLVPIHELQVLCNTCHDRKTESEKAV
jgi:5-methylcytosine-specific restriction endonuclease McrA